MSDASEYEMAHRAFEMFTLPERERALERFAALKYPSLRDRFFDAVHFVIASVDPPPPASADLKE